LAVDVKQQGKGYGKILLVDALKRSHETSKEIGSFAVVVDPIDDSAEGFYKRDLHERVDYGNTVWENMVG